MLKRAIRWLSIVPLVLILAGLAGTVVPRPLWPVANAGGEGGAMQRILVLSNPIHTDIAIPVTAETLERFAFLADSGMPVSHPAARWLVFGRGGRAFYIETPRWADLKPMPLLKGLTLDRAVVHADVLGEVAEPSDHVAGFEIGRAEYERLLGFIAASFQAEGDGITAIPGAGYGPDDRFFAANGWFSALFGCNVWTAAALREAGLRTGWWNPLPQSLAVSMRLYN